jgi:glucose/arabinose dehydrogenase
MSIPLQAGTPPEGFVETVLVDGSAATGASGATAIAYEPGTGDLWVVEKGPGSELGQARVRVRDAGTGQVRTALTLHCVDSQGERGLLGIAFSPDYLDGPSTRHVYLYSTRRFEGFGTCTVSGVPDGSRNRVSRFLESGGTLSGEEKIYETPSLTSRTNHNGGTVRFAPDGTLFISIGDNDTDADANPLSRDRSDPRGKLLRVNADGTAPGDNPFFGQPGILPEIWAWGLRNPFRFSIDPAGGAPFIADVGERNWEAIYFGVPGGDYGYPCVEGSAPFRGCNPAPPAGSIVDPIFVYGHGNETPPVSGRSVTGGPVYRATAFPLDYRDRYYFADWVAGWIRSGRVTAANQIEDVQIFVPDAGGVVDMIVSPAGCLTYVVLGDAVRNVCVADSGADQDNDGWTIDDGDCNDFDPVTFPGAPDICDGADNSCSGTPDDATCDQFVADGDGSVDGRELALVGVSFGLCSADPPSESWSVVNYFPDDCIDGDDLAVLAAVWPCSDSAAVCP